MFRHGASFSNAMVVRGAMDNKKNRKKRKKKKIKKLETKLSRTSSGSGAHKETVGKERMAEGEEGRVHEEQSRPDPSGTITTKINFALIKLLLSWSYQTTLTHIQTRV